MDILVVAQWCLFQVKDFQFPMLCQRAGAQEAVKKHSQDSWSELTKGIFHTTKCYVQCINEEGVGQDLQVVRNCIVHNLFLLSFLPLSLFFTTSIIIVIIIFYVVSIIRLFLAQPTSFTFFLILLPTPLGKGWANSCTVLVCWLGLNHDTSKTKESKNRGHGGTKPGIAKLEQSEQK